MKNHPLVIIAYLLLFGCSDDIDYKEANPLTTMITTQPTPSYSQTKNAYFGDLHIHTSWSFDAFVSGVRTSPDDAYRFGKGESIPHVSGKSIQMNRPLDFMAVSDHAEYMGAMMQMLDKENQVAALSISKKVMSMDQSAAKKANRNLRLSIATNWPYQELITQDILQGTWQKIVEAADQHYEPGKFTTFPAFEWTSSIAVYSSLLSSTPYAQNLHRNVIFKGGKVAGVPFSSFDSQNPEDLWKWMDIQRQQGIELLAIPHNGNISDGRMYATSTYNGNAIDKNYIQTRMKNEPINEVAQNKGQSMAHPALSPNDEFADFEVYQYALGTGDPRKEGLVSGSFVREAFKNGLAIAQDVGSNPFQFGVIGSSDSHNSGPNVEENNNLGKSGKDATPEIRFADDKAGPRNRKSSVGGLAGVWATENTREAIYEALERKEVFATAGTRLKVRLFASWDWDTLSLAQDNWLEKAYKLGIPMGGNLRSQVSGGRSQKAPSFLINALKDTEGANLDRIQVIKGWVDSKGQTDEKIYNVVWSDDRQIEADGKLPTIGNTVDTSKATYTNTIGSVQLKTVWSDPDFDPAIPAFYYLRVLEIPTPRWTTYEAVELGVPLPKEVPPTIQERAWSSPIWYQPN